MNIKEIFNKFVASFDNTNIGMSARKLTSFALVVCIGWLHYKFVTPLNAVEFLMIDLLGVLILLGIITIEQVIKLKNGNTQSATQ
jgi:hypothetical protein